MNVKYISRYINEDINAILEELEFEEPLTEFTYNKKTYPSWGNIIGRNKTAEYDKGKFNRYAKFGTIADELTSRLKNIIVNNPKSVDAHCAYACLLMMEYGVRVGNEDSAEGYTSGLEKNKGEIVQTFGTTTLKNDHISFEEDKMMLNFLGKEQVQHKIIIDNPFLVKYGRFYSNDITNEKWLKIDYDIIFKFIKQEVGKAFVPKDLRTFCANVTGWNAMQPYLDKPMQDMKSDAKTEIKDVVEVVAARLGNTPGIARRAYLDSRMLDWFLAQRFEEDSE